jgi:putative transferase (TIGR04331 family)
LRYWRIVIGPWLSIFVPTVWERWENLKVVFQDHDFNEVFVSEPDFCDFSKVDYAESNALLQDQKWNYQIYSDMILFQYSNACTIKACNVENHSSSYSAKRNKNSISNLVHRFIDKGIAKIQKNYKVVFISSYFDIRSLLKLSIKLRQFPRRYFQFDDVFFKNKTEVIKRNKTINFSCDNDFESYLSNNLFKHIPYSYIEGFNSLKEKAIQSNVNGKIIFTSNAHFSNDFFKVWCAEQVIKNESKLFISVHGGAIPSSMSAFARHEDIVSDKRIVWHKALNEKQVRLPPNKFIRARKIRLENNSDVTIVGLDLGIYSYGHQSGPNSSLILEDFNQKVEFIRKIPTSHQTNIKVFPYPHSGWDTKHRYVDIFGKAIISSSETFIDAICNSKIIVCTYPQTTFSEAMYSNTPVILLYIEEYWELRPEFKTLISIMKDAKIIFSDADLAAKHIGEIYAEPEIWWASHKVVTARNKFYELCLRTSDDWLAEWDLFFRRELA